MAYTLPTLESKSDYLKSKFSTIAARYDLFNDLVTQGMHRRWKNFLIQKTSLKEGDTALDLCCGTGDITQRLEKRVGKKGTVIGLDFAGGMLQVAKHRKQGKESRSFLQGDAMDLPFQDESANAITMGYGLRNVTNIPQCLDEVYRTLKPGGHFVSLDVGKVNLPIIRSFFQLYFFQIVPIIGKILYRGEEMFDYLPHSSVDYPSQEKLAGILEKAGFEKVQFFNFVFGGNAIHVATKPVHSKTSLQKAKR